MIVGEEAGPKKLATAEELGIKMLSEDGLFDLIRERSGQNVDVNSSNTSSKEKVEKKPSPGKRKTEKHDNEIPEKKVKKESPKKSSNEVKLETTTITDQKPLENVENLAWVEKYKPTNLKQIIGQQGAASNVVKFVF